MKRPIVAMLINRLQGRPRSRFNLIAIIERAREGIAERRGPPSSHARFGLIKNERGANFVRTIVIRAHEIAKESHNP